MSLIVRLFAALLLSSAGPAPTLGKIQGRKNSLRANVDKTAFQNEVREAVREAMGCGGHTSDEQVAKIREIITPIFRTLPKNGHGRIERRSLRHIVYRYFNQKSALIVRGFELARPAHNDSAWGTADILSQRVPAYVESALESNHAQEHGFDLDDAVHMVVTIAELIFDSESTLLEKAYASLQKSTATSLTQSSLHQVLDAYIVHWMMGSVDGINVAALLRNEKLLKKSFPVWDHLSGLVRGQVQAFDYQKQKKPRASRSPFDIHYKFDDAHEIVGSITRTFASFWESECATMKNQLMTMDAQGTGRVPLARFYGTGLDEDWRFGESEVYLRELGALDETSSWRGKQVIVPNYMQAASNCIITTDHYNICCQNDCESIFMAIEANVSAPSALPETLLDVVSQMSYVSQETLDESAAHLDRTLTRQLQQIAAAHGGRVPLHGRLFAQWLHYVFPRECPFPHKAGTAVTATPTQYGTAYRASENEMQQHASAANDTALPSSASKEELEWMSQWSEEEELIADYARHLRAPWELSGRRLAALGGLGAGLLAVMVAFSGAFAQSKSASSGGLLPTYRKDHFV